MADSDDSRGSDGSGSESALAGAKRKHPESSDESDGDVTKPAPKKIKEEVDEDDGSSAPQRTKEGQEEAAPSREVLLAALPPEDKRKFLSADGRRKEDEKAVMAAHARLVKRRGDYARAKAELDKAQKAYDEARARSQEHSEQDADNLLLEPSEWNQRYLQLKSHFDREGHSRLKRNVADADVEGLTESEAADARSLARWASRQRKLKRSGDLDHYKVMLLNRLAFDWDPKTGHGPEKWLKNYNLLKEFKEEHGHVQVPMQYGENKLGLWVKTQLTLYRNGKDGKLPALSAERIRMLEELGISWGVRRKGIPWEERFKALLEYKKRFGHVHVPWQWKENIGLAQWVNTQRKKYHDLKNGKKNNLSDEQIKMLNSIGFKWSTGGKGRYTIDSPTDEKKPAAAASPAAATSENAVFAEIAAAARGSTAQPNSIPSNQLSSVLAQSLLGGVVGSYPNSASQPSLTSSLSTPSPLTLQQQLQLLLNQQLGMPAATAPVAAETSLNHLLTHHLIRPAPSQAPHYALHQLLNHPVSVSLPSHNDSSASAQQPSTIQLLSQASQLAPPPPSTISVLQAPAPSDQLNLFQQLLSQQMNQPSPRESGTPDQDKK